MSRLQSTLLFAGILAAVCALNSRAVTGCGTAGLFTVAGPLNDITVPQYQEGGLDDGTFTLYSVRVLHYVLRALAALLLECSGSSVAGGLPGWSLGNTML